MDKAHEERVREFLRGCREKDPSTYEEVTRKYPVQNSARKQIIRNREITVGLLGLQASRISSPVAEKYDLETIYMMDEKE